jgi:hypothetical protein
LWFIFLSIQTMTQQSCLKVNRPPVAGDRKIRFQNATVFSFPVGIGQNPSVSRGCPIALKGFKAIDKTVEDFDVYMYERSGEMRPHSQLRLGPLIRTGMLVKQGYSLTAIVNATAAALELRAMRNESLQKSSWEDMKSFFGSKQKAFATRMLAIATSPRNPSPEAEETAEQLQNLPKNTYLCSLQHTGMTKAKRRKLLLLLAWEYYKTIIIE